METLIVIENGDIVGTLSSESMDPFSLSLKFRDINWPREQLADLSVGRVRNSN